MSEFLACFGFALVLVVVASSVWLEDRMARRGKFRSLRGGRKKHLRKYYSSRGGIRL